MTRSSTFVRLFLAAVLPLTAVMGLVGCTTTSIAAIKEDPSEFSGRVVTVRGEVERIYRVPFTDASVFILADETGTIPVFSTIDRREGESVTVRAEAIGVSGDAGSEGGRRASEAIERFLVENGIVEANVADEIASGIYNLINGVSRAVEGTYFLLEEREP